MVYRKLINFWKVLPKILSVPVKDNSCNSPEDLKLYLKDTSTQVFSSQYSKNFQPPQEHLSFLQNLLNFIIRKYLKQEVDDDLSVCVNEHNLCGLYISGNKNLSMSRDLKVMKLLPPMEKCSMDFYEGAVFTAKIW